MKVVEWHQSPFEGGGHSFFVPSGRTTTEPPGQAQNHRLQLFLKDIP
jgi:hypothetical protein